MNENSMWFRDILEVWWREGMLTLKIKWMKVSQTFMEKAVLWNKDCTGVLKDVLCKHISKERVDILCLTNLKGWQDHPGGKALTFYTLLTPVWPLV